MIMQQENSSTLSRRLFLAVSFLLAVPHFYFSAVLLVASIIPFAFRRTDPVGDLIAIDTLLLAASIFFSALYLRGIGRLPRSLSTLQKRHYEFLAIFFIATIFRMALLLPSQTFLPAYPASIMGSGALFLYPAFQFVYVWNERWRSQHEQPQLMK